MASFRLKWDKDLLRRIEALGIDVGRTLEVGVKRILLYIGEQISEQIKPGAALDPHSGFLARSWVSRSAGAESGTSVGGTSVNGFLASGSKYAAIHEYGGMVAPTKAKMLSIPLDAAKTKAGVARQSSPRNYTGLVLRRSKSGKLFLVRPKVAREAVARSESAKPRRKTGKLPPIVKGDKLMFLLVEKVRIPASEYVSKALKAAEPGAEKIIDATMQQRLDKLTAGA